MTAFDYFLTGWLMFGMVVTVTNVGKPRKPLEPGVAAVSAVITFGLIAWLLVSRGVLG